MEIFVQFYIPYSASLGSVQNVPVYLLKINDGPSLKATILWCLHVKGAVAHIITSQFVQFIVGRCVAR